MSLELVIVPLDRRVLDLGIDCLNHFKVVGLSVECGVFVHLNSYVVQSVAGISDISF